MLPTWRSCASIKFVHLGSGASIKFVPAENGKKAGTFHFDFRTWLSTSAELVSSPQPTGPRGPGRARRHSSGITSGQWAEWGQARGGAPIARCQRLTLRDRRAGRAHRRVADSDGPAHEERDSVFANHRYCLNRTIFKFG